MNIVTKAFGEIEVTEEKVITFPGGIIGYPQLTRFTLLHDEEKGTDSGIHWMQSLQEAGFAIPVMDPLIVMPEYNPEVEDELLKLLGELKIDNLLVMVSVTVPSDLTRMTTNMQGPFIINADTKMACQVIVEGKEYPVKFPIYDILKARKAGE